MMRVPEYRAEVAASEAHTRHTLGDGSRTDSYSGSGVTASSRSAKSLAYSRSVVFQSTASASWRLTHRHFIENSWHDSNELPCRATRICANESCEKLSRRRSSIL